LRKVSGLLDARLRHSYRYLDNEGRRLGTDTQYCAYTRCPWLRPVGYLYLPAGAWSHTGVRSTMNPPAPVVRFCPHWA